MADLDFPLPEEGAIITILLISNDVARSRDFYADVLGGEIIRAKAPVFVKLWNTWIIINEGGGPTEDKPEIIMAPPSDRDTVGICMNFRVADVQKLYDEISARGGKFITPPQKREMEIRCYLRDPDGYLIEFGQTTISAQEWASR